MANAFHGNVPGKDTGKKSGKPPALKRGVKADALREGTAAWPGVPGKTQPRTRDKAGTRKGRQSARSTGI